MQWVRGDFIRYLRICFDELFYNMCCRRLQRALIFLRYPLWVLERQRVSWADRPNYLVRSRDLVVAVGGFFQSKILLERTTMIVSPCHKLSGTVLCPRWLLILRFVLVYMYSGCNITLLSLCAGLRLCTL